MNKMPLITKVLIAGPLRMEIDWDTGETLAVDISSIIARNQAFASLNDAEFFGRVTIEQWGHGLDWHDGLDLGADRLYDLGREQAGMFSPAKFDDWMRKNGLSLSSAATALGMSRRMIAHYRHGSRPIPRTVHLACIGWETEQLRKAA
jgi:hypothetical protein